MDQDAINLFHELADRTPSEREDYYERRQVPATVRAEVESLLRFDREDGPSLGAYLASAAKEVLLQADRVPEIIAHYRITGLLGEGGMGKVYRAADTKLGRQVAIKVIPQNFAQDAGRMGRFLREAKVLASLNHPNIAAIYGVEDRALVIELVEGPTLAERMAKGALPLSEALDIARQLVDALEAAHEKSVIHRDLKPSNIKVNPDGIVKVLDFGLAVTQASGVVSPSSLNSTTPIIAQTESGIILGTPAYMSPEQARGKQVDKRADIWAFGVVLYEMLTGRRLFEGETVADILAAVLNTEPDWKLVPGKVQHLLRVCLEKDPKRRLQAIGDARLLLEDPPEMPSSSWPADTRAPQARRRWLVFALAALLALAGGALALEWGRRGSPTFAGDWQLSLSAPPGRDLSDIGHLSSATPEISPDGSMIVAKIGDSLALRRLNSSVWTPLAGTGRGDQVFWSADSQEIAFWDSGRLMKMRVPNGAPEVVRETGIYTRGGDWSSQGEILNSSNGSLWTGPASGGPAHELANGELVDPHWPHYLPDGEHFIFSGYNSKAEEGPVESRGIYLGASRNGQWKLRPVRLRASLNEARYSPANGGSLLFLQNGNLYAQRLNVPAARLEGAPELVAQGVASSTMFGNSHFSVSMRGPLAWRPGKAAVAELTWFDRKGAAQGVTGPADAWGVISLAPDERRIVALAEHALVNEIQILESGKSGFVSLASSSGSREIGFSCLWLSESDQILFPERDNNVHEVSLIQQPVDGGPRREIGKGPYFFLNGMSANGKRLLVWSPEHRHPEQPQGPSIKSRLVLFPFPPDDSSWQPIDASEGLTNSGAISPDGNWVVYGGPAALFVQPVHGHSRRQQISANRGMMPFWRADGREIVYLGSDHRIWSIAVDPSRGEFGAAVALFPVRLPAIISQSRLLAVTRDGSRILFAQAVSQPESGLIDIAENWTKIARQASAQ